MFTIYKNYSWNYNDALVWLKLRQKFVLDKLGFYIAFCSHNPPVVTLGKNTSYNDILNIKALKLSGAFVKKVDRGGGITIHNLGQLVVYPVISLDYLKIGIKEFTYFLEECMIEFLNYWGINSCRGKRYHGIYVNNEKIGFIGFRVFHGVITHGICLNISNDLSLYSYIVPCYQENLKITSLQMLIKNSIETSYAAIIFEKIFLDYFRNIKYII
jgi:lipoate-protein ligase B